MVAQVDYVRRLGENVSLGEVDLNLFSRVNSAGAPAPVIPLCKPSQNLVASAQCSTGAITFWEDQGRQLYNGLASRANGMSNAANTWSAAAG